jgi:hypothetical protein
MRRWIRSTALLRGTAVLALAAGLTAAPSLSSPGVAQPAAVPGPVAISVTGGPATVDTLRLAITTAARLALHIPASALVRVGDTQPALVPLDASAAENVTAGLNITAPGSASALRPVRVALTNAILPWNDADILLVSNSPETIPFSKVLYTGALSTAQTVRLLFHHQNGSKAQHMFIGVTLSNPTGATETLWVQGAAGEPSTDEVAPGHGAAKTFLDEYVHHAGFLVRLPANTTVPLFLDDVQPLGVASGIAQFGLIDGDRLNVQVVARLADDFDPPAMSFAPDFDRVHQRGAFVRPLIGRTLTYTVGGPPATTVLAADADLLKEGASGALLQGNYGVIYRYDVVVDNPTASPASAALVLHADGGQARGTFVIGDQLVESPLVQPNAPKAVATFPLPPQTRRTLQMWTIPESGSNYPVRLTLGAP